MKRNKPASTEKTPDALKNEHAGHPGQLWRRLGHTFHTSSTFVAYLRGDVKKAEQAIACEWEYARESPLLWEAAGKVTQFRREGKLDRSEAALAVVAGKPNPILGALLTFLECESFPKKDWNELSETERNRITRFRPRQIEPLPLAELPVLKCLLSRSKPAPDPGPVWQLQEGSQFFYAAFALDFSKTRRRLCNEFLKFLLLPENEARFTKHRREIRGTTGGPLDRLEDLARWRLYRELGNDADKASDFAKQDRSDADWRRAEGRAKEHLERLFPQEFPFSLWRSELFKELEKLAKGSEKLAWRA